MNDRTSATALDVPTAADLDRYRDTIAGIVEQGQDPHVRPGQTITALELGHLAEMVTTAGCHPRHCIAASMLAGDDLALARARAGSGDPADERAQLIEVLSTPVSPARMTRAFSPAHAEVLELLAAGTVEHGRPNPALTAMLTHRIEQSHSGAAPALRRARNDAANLCAERGIIDPAALSTAVFTQHLDPRAVETRGRTDAIRMASASSVCVTDAVLSAAVGTALPEPERRLLRASGLAGLETLTTGHRPAPARPDPLAQLRALTRQTAPESSTGPELT